MTAGETIAVALSVIGFCVALWLIRVSKKSVEERREGMSKNFNDIVELLNNNTSDGGSWSIDFNDHKTNYETPEEYHGYNYLDNENMLEGVDTKKDIYYLHWYKDTPVGFLSGCFNTLDKMYEFIEKVILEENK